MTDEDNLHEYLRHNQENIRHIANFFHLLQLEADPQSWQPFLDHLIAEYWESWSFQQWLEERPDSHISIARRRFPRRQSQRLSDVYQEYRRCLIIRDEWQAVNLSGMAAGRRLEQLQAPERFYMPQHENSLPRLHFARNITEPSPVPSESQLTVEHARLLPKPSHQRHEAANRETEGLAGAPSQSLGQGYNSVEFFSDYDGPGQRFNPRYPSLKRRRRRSSETTT